MLAIVKKYAAKANRELGFLDEDYADTVVDTAQEVIEGKYLDQFPLYVFQAGAGTPWNMNEVLIGVNEDVTEGYFRYSNAISTLLSPLIGYDDASKLAEETQKTSESVGEIAIAKGFVAENEMDRILEHSTEPNLIIIQEIKEERKIDQET
jgi:fumarate hydratase class II